MSKVVLIKSGTTYTHTPQVDEICSPSYFYTQTYPKENGVIQYNALNLPVYIHISPKTPTFTAPESFARSTAFTLTNNGPFDIYVLISSSNGDDQDAVSQAATSAPTKRKATVPAQEPDTASSKIKKSRQELTSTPSKEKEKADKKSTKKAATEDEKKQEDEEPVNLNVITKLPSGLQFKDEDAGSGNTYVGRGSIVSIRYQGMFPDGRVFDGNMPKGTPLTFTIGAGQVIKGMEQGMIGMKLNGKRRLIIPSHLGYGREGSGPIPGNSTLIFDVSVIKLNGGVKNKP